MKQTLTGTVSKLLYEDETKQIIRLNTQHIPVKVLVNAPLSLVEENDHVSIAGRKEYHPYFGDQFIAESIEHCTVSRDLVAGFLMSSSGIGEKTVTKLLSAIGERILDVLEQKDIDSLYFDGKISRTAAEVICHNWHKHTGKLQFIEFMNNVLTKAKATKRAELMKIGKRAFAYYGAQTEEKLREDPYRVWAFSSFKLAELLAEAFGVLPHDKRRLICAVEDTLFKHLKGGNTRVSPFVFADDLSKLVGREMVQKALDVAAECGDSERPRIIITNDKQASNKENKHRYYALPSAALMENYVKGQLLSRMREGILSIQVSVEVLEQYTIPGGHRLSSEQQEAVKMVLSNTVSCVSGGAGTGKTSVMYCAHDIITSSGNKVLQVALSGKAARRLAQQTERDAMTIEKLLKIVERKPNYLDDFPCPLVLIDEASMVDLHTIYRLLHILEGKPARIVFVGDWAQLPPVGPGLIYHQLMQSNVVPRLKLTQNFRSIKGIKEASESIKKGTVFPESKSVRIIECEDVDSMKQAAEREYRYHLYADSLHVVAARTRTVADINMRLQVTLTANRKVIPCAPQFRVGDAVVYKTNDEELGIVNGSTGCVIDGDDESIHVDFDVEGKISIPKENVTVRKLGEYLLQHGYALTCHSAQGSEFEVVIVVVEDMPMVERSWLYTAVTRAKQKVIVITSNDSINKALFRGFAAQQISVGFQL